jgi:geranylgeranyl diphosphate synthase type I
MAQEVVHGQYLEVQVSFAGEAEEEDLLRVLRLKSGRYSVERPLQLGALVAGAGPDQLDALSVYGRALGEAFQLQDDLLGTFGEPEVTGKPVGADLAEGKFTLLVYHARRNAQPEDRAWLDEVRASRAGGAAEARRLSALLTATGAARRVRAMVGERLALARESLGQAAFAAAGRDFLAGLIAYSEERDR